MKNLGLLLLYVTSLSLLVSSKDVSQDISCLIPESRFNEMLKHRNDQYCEGGRLYTYASFIEAAKSFNGFATTGDTTTRKREIAAFFAHTSHQSVGWSGEKEPKDIHAWGYCRIYSGGGNHPRPEENCRPSVQWPCAQDKSYHPRGLFAITGNENYGQAGKAIGADLLGNPDLVNSDPTIAFKTALWVWMTPQSPKPSSHDVITRQWKACEPDKAAGRVPGFGLTTNIITSGNDCSKDAHPSVDRRIGFYKRYCRLLGVSPGGHLDCSKQKPFA